MHFLQFQDFPDHQGFQESQVNSVKIRKTEDAVVDADSGFGSSDSNDYCIIMNVAMAHQPARYMRKDNIRRGVTIVDAKVDQITSK